MKALVDETKCNSTGECVKVAPEIFRFHEGSKKAFVKVADIPPEHREKCLKAERLCPTKAIKVWE